MALRNDEIFVKELVMLTSKYSNNNTMRRIGYCLEYFGVDSALTDVLHNKLKPIKSWVPLNPLRSGTGTTHKKWCINDNVHDNR